jgi:hypothetical protein
VVDEGLGGEVAGSDVAICAHLLAQREDALLWPDPARPPFWTPNGAEEDCICGLGGAESLGGQGLAGGIN